MKVTRLVHVKKRGAHVRELREITDNEKEILVILHDHIQKKITLNQKLLAENYITQEDQSSPRYYWRNGCIDSLEQMRQYVDYLQGLKYI